MAKKEKTHLPLSDDTGRDFADDDFILNYRPKIDFVAPEHVPSEKQLSSEDVDDVQQSLRERTRNLIAGFEALGKLAELAETRIDQRMQALGGLDIHLDPYKDAGVIMALKRRFPDKVDTSVITYEDYKECVKGQKNATAAQPGLTVQDMRNAQADPLRTDFGGLWLRPGESRPEINSTGTTVEPVSLVEFQANALITLFGMLKDMITDLVLSLIPGGGGGGGDDEGSNEEGEGEGEGEGLP